MRFRSFWAGRVPAAAAIMLVSLLSLPQFLPAQQSPVQQGKLNVHPPAPVTVKRGGTATAVVRVSVLPGYHVNSDKPKDEYLIPLQLTWQNGGDIRPGATIYPPAEETQVGQDKLSVFTGDFDLKTSVSAPASAPAGSTQLTGKLHYQACNDRMCFRPATVEIHVPVVLE